MSEDANVQEMGDTGSVTVKENPAAQNETTASLVNKAHKGELANNKPQKPITKLSRKELIRTLTVCRNQANDWLHATIDIACELLLVNPKHDYFKKGMFHESTMMRVLALAAEKIDARCDKFEKEEDIPEELKSLKNVFLKFRTLQMEFKGFSHEVIQSPLGKAFMQQIDTEMKSLMEYFWNLER